MTRKVSEAEVERYFVQQVHKHGGIAKKLTGQIHDPDRLVIWPKRLAFGRGPICGATIHFVELKAPDGRLRPGQRREHERLRAFGCNVFVLYSKHSVDFYIRYQRHGC
jgi:hypothetical protein